MLRYSHGTWSLDKSFQDISSLIFYAMVGCMGWDCLHVSSPCFPQKCHGMPGAMSGMQSRTAKWMGQHVPGIVRKGASLR